MLTEPVHIDELFDSIDAWLHWSAANPAVFDRAVGERIGRRICAHGFVEPLTGRAVPADVLNPDERNWREGLLAHGLNSRMRAVLQLLEQKANGHAYHDLRIFGAEAVTAFALLLRGIFARFLGSEYGRSQAVRDALYPIPHQDLTQLSLPTDTFDFVITNEVLEHVPDLDAALAEIARVLKPGGWHVGTHPFHIMRPTGDLRTRLVDGELEYLLPPEYHGDPMDPAGGALVFEIPGWDILARARAVGLGDAHMRFVACERHGVVTENLGVFVFCARKT